MKDKIINTINEILKTKEIKYVPGIMRSLCKKNKEMYNFIFSTFTFGNSFSQRLYNIYYDIKEWPVCEYEHCNNLVEFQRFNSGYRKTCSKWCTNYIKYGCKSTFGTKEQHDKAKETMLKKYGYSCGAANPNIREKMIKTMKEKYGDIYQKLPEYKEKVKKTNFERYGAKHIMSTSEGIKRAQKTQREKYNGLLFTQTNEFKNFCRNKLLYDDRRNKMSKGRRDVYFKKLLDFAENEGYEILISNNEYLSQFDKKDKKWIKYPFRCKNCNYEFNIGLNNILRDGINCPKCKKIGKSIAQHKIFEYISKKYFNHIFIEDECRILDNRQEIDIYCEDLKFGIEYNGNCWHAQKFNNKNKNYHFNKFLNFEKHNIRTLSFWSDEFETHSEQIYKMIDLFFNDLNCVNIDDYNFYEIDKINSKELEHICFSNIGNDKFLCCEDFNKNIILILKYCFEESILVIDEIMVMNNINLKDSLFESLKFLRRKFNLEIYLQLDNRFISFYKLFFNNCIKFIGYKEPGFHKLQNGREKIICYDEDEINLNLYDIIWSYGTSLFKFVE